MASQGMLKRRVAAVAAAGTLSLGGLVGLGLSASPASAHGCGHLNHFDYYNGHKHAVYYQGYQNSGGYHWHLWRDAHRYVWSAC